MIPQIFILALVVLIALVCMNMSARANLLRDCVRRDVVRFKFFAARDRLYLAAAKGLIPVDSQAFIKLRDLLNGVIYLNETMDMHVYIGALTREGSSTFSDVNKDLSITGQREWNSIYLNVGKSLMALMAVNSNIVKLLIKLENTQTGKRQIDPVMKLDREVKVLEARELVTA